MTRLRHDVRHIGPRCEQEGNEGAAQRVRRHVRHRLPPRRPQIEAPESALLDLEAYEQPILQTLAERGGRATRCEIIAALEEAMADRHSARDLEALPSGAPRWQPRVGKVRARLVQRGWLRTGKGRGCEWELTERGRVRARTRRSDPGRGPAPWPDRYGTVRTPVTGSG